MSDFSKSSLRNPSSPSEKWLFRKLKVTNGNVVPMDNCSKNRLNQSRAQNDCVPTNNCRGPIIVSEVLGKLMTKLNSRFNNYHQLEEKNIDKQQLKSNKISRTKMSKNEKMCESKFIKTFVKEKNGAISQYAAPWSREITQDFRFLFLRVYSTMKDKIAGNRNIERDDDYLIANQESFDETEKIKKKKGNELKKSCSSCRRAFKVSCDRTKKAMKNRRKRVKKSVGETCRRFSKGVINILSTLPELGYGPITQSFISDQYRYNLSDIYDPSYECYTRKV